MNVIKCPFCSAINKPYISTSWSCIGYTPIVCEQCANIIWIHNASNVDVEVVSVNKANHFKVNIPNIPINTWVFVINKEHPKYLEPGQITKLDHNHCRIKFVDNKQLWVPVHWIEIVPWEV
ncbi:MAG: hypothetical protein QXP41_00395 [Candidatus Nitrosocaldus sp.]